MTRLTINAGRLLGHLQELGRKGRDEDGRLIRLAASDADKAGRDLFVAWIRSAGLDLCVDRVGNIFGVWKRDGNAQQAPVMLGSHIDTVVDAGIYDGAYGVLAALEVIETLKDSGFDAARPIAVAAFTNEEGVRYAPTMMGSLVHCGAMSVDEAQATVGTDGTSFGAELERIGYAGDMPCGALRPHAYVELHIEQGPVLNRAGIAVGAVEGLQGISWQKITVSGAANHAGTTPMSMRRDAGHAAARIIAFVHDRAKASATPMVATVGSISFEPNVINVIPSRATLTVDLRDPDEQRLQAEEAALADYLDKLAAAEDVTISVERLARFEPVAFDATIVAAIEAAAKGRGLVSKRMISGAGHDAKSMARIVPAAMIFVPSIDGISHSPLERTPDSDIVAGANVLLDVAARLAAAQ